MVLLFQGVGQSPTRFQRQTLELGSVASSENHIMKNSHERTDDTDFHKMPMHAKTQPSGEHFSVLFLSPLTAWLRAGDGQRCAANEKWSMQK